MSKTRKRYVQVGVGSRSGMFTRAVTQTYAEFCELAAVCDTNQGRLDFCSQRFGGDQGFATYKADQFDRMIAETKPDIVIVSSMDSTHCQYVCRAMELGCDVITEKPLTVDAASCRRILRTMDETGRNVVVTFNARYGPPRTQIKDILQSGEIGDILSTEFTWKLNTSHGADYFRRWHRRREFSGSLLIHKATHHFDLLNWWLDDIPEQVFAHASLRYYTPATGDRLGLTDRGERCLDCPARDRCQFFWDIKRDEGCQSLYLNCEHEDGYFRDRCVFSPEIDIWDTMSLSVKYRGGTILSYLLHAYCPFEGFRVAFNGSEGRLEHVSGMSGIKIGSTYGELQSTAQATTLTPVFGEPQAIEVRTGEGTHGGGDPLLCADLFDPELRPDPSGRRADALAGVYSVLIGAAASQSIDTDNPVRIADLLDPSA